MKKSHEDDLRDQLREAARKGDLAAVRKLLDRGVNPHWCDVANRFTLLNYAGEGGNMAVLSEFFRAGLDLYPK